MKDIKDMQFINHIITKHKIPATLIVVSVLMLIVHFVSTSLAAPTPYAPSATLNPVQGPGDAFVELPTSQWIDSGNDIYFSAGLTKTIGGLVIHVCESTPPNDGACPSSPVEGQMWLDATP